MEQSEKENTLPEPPICATPDLDQLIAENVPVLPLYGTPNIIDPPLAPSFVQMPKDPAILDKWLAAIRANGHNRPCIKLTQEQRKDPMCRAYAFGVNYGHFPSEADHIAAVRRFYDAVGYPEGLTRESLGPVGEEEAGVRGPGEEGTVG